MKRFLLLAFGLVVCLLPSQTDASHVVGAQTSIECINACTTRVHFRGYRSCSGATVIANNVIAEPDSGCAQLPPITNWSVVTTLEVTPLCLWFTPTNCSNPQAQFPGVEEHHSFRDYDICSTSPCNYTLTWTTCCRNGVVTSGSANEGVYLGATTLNTTLPTCNNSPEFTTPPFFYICAGQPFIIPQNAVDPDGDSLTFSLGTCFSAPNTPSTYGPGYSPTQPLGPSWTTSIDPVTGDISLMPNPGNQVAGIFCVTIEEWRNGVQIGTLVRDFQVTTIACPQGLCGSNTIEGTVYLDQDADCLFDSTEATLGGWQLMINPGGYLWPVGLDGNYNFSVGPGTYTVALLPPSNGLWQAPCPSTHTVTFPAQNGTSTGNDFGVTPTVYCPSMWVDVGSNFLRPCQNTTFAVSYCNNGTDTAFNAYVELVLDSNFYYQSSTIPPASVSGGVHTFQLGDVPPGVCGQFWVVDSLACIQSLTGTTLCATANIYPDSFCTPADTTWDNSSVAVTGQCFGDSLLCFTVYNTGSSANGNMQGPTDWRLYENGTQIANGTLQLCGGCDTTLCFPGNGNTMRLEVDQRPGHPGNSQPNSTVENCGSPNGASGGFNLLPQDDGNDFVAIDCQVVINSYDPNSKRVAPSGVDPVYHYVDSTAILEYFIDFQNSGSADALEVILEDSLDARLDLTTFVPGASSHPYTWEITTGRLLRFTFSNINLPPESQDSLGSIGFVKFYIGLLPGLATGDRIENHADIYFDNNSPIRTNTVWNTVGWPISTGNLPVPMDPGILVYPNPSRGEVFFEVPEQELGSPIVVELYSLTGKKLYQGQLASGHRTRIDLNQQPQGVYLYRVHQAGKMLKAGKLLRQ